MLKRERDPGLDAFDRGCLVLRRDGETVGHVATTLGTFWSPGRARTVQQWVWLVVVWADGKKERAVEDYPPWTYVREIWDGKFIWPYPGLAAASTRWSRCPTTSVKPSGRSSA